MQRRLAIWLRTIPLFVAIVLLTALVTGCGTVPQPVRPAPPAAPQPLPVVTGDDALRAALQKSGIKSPDGTWIAAALVTPGHVGVWMVQAGGSNLRQLSTMLSPSITPPVWTPQGQLLFLDENLGWNLATTDGVVRPFLPDLLAGKSAHVEGFTLDGRLVYLTNWCYCLTPENDRRPKELWTVGVDGSNPLKLATVAPEHDPAQPATAPVYLPAGGVGLAGGFAVLRHYAPGPKLGQLDNVLEAVRLDGRQSQVLVRQPVTANTQLLVTVAGNTVTWQYVQQVPVVTPPGQTPPPPTDPNAPPPTTPQMTTKTLASGQVTLSALVFENPSLGIRWSPPSTFTIQEAPDGRLASFRPEATCNGPNCAAVVVRLCANNSLLGCVPELPTDFKAPAPVPAQVGTLKAQLYVITRTSGGMAWQERHTILARTSGALDFVAVVSGMAAPTPQDTAALDAYANLLATVQLTGK